MSCGWLRDALLEGLAIPAHPLALSPQRRLDERRQRALTRYYHAAGSGGVAVAVHTTQFAIRAPRAGLLRPVLSLAAESVRGCDASTGRRSVLIGGICGETAQAVAEAAQLHTLGYDAGLLSLAALGSAEDGRLIAHAAEVGECIPLLGFYLQPAVGGRRLGRSFWRSFLEIPSVVAVKIAPFNRYQTLDVIQALAESGRRDVALYTGNDDNIVADLITPHRLMVNGASRELRIVGGLLGHWSVWTRHAVGLHRRCRALARGGDPVPQSILAEGSEVTIANAALFDAAHGFRGCIAGIQEVLRRQGLLESAACLDPKESPSPGQAAELDRICRLRPMQEEAAWIRDHLPTWMGD